MTTALDISKSSKPWFSLIFAILLLALSTGLFLSTSLDDIYLTYWPAHTLSSQGQILNYNGERLEQSSSLLHVALLASLARPSHLSFPLLAFLTALISGILTVFATKRLATLIDPSFSGYSSLLLLSTCPFFVYYSVNTLETALAALLVTLLLICIQRFLFQGTGLPGLAIYIMLFLSVRAETFLLLAVPILALLIWSLIFPSLPGPLTSGLLRRRLLAILSLCIGLQLAICGFRYVYFGDYVPHTVRAKISTLSYERLRNGFLYFFGQSVPVGRGKAIMRWYFPFGLTVVTVILFNAANLIKDLHFRRTAASMPRTMFPFLFLASYFMCVAIVGGDWMEGGRFLVPILPVLFVLLTADTRLYFHSRRLLVRLLPIIVLVSYHMVGNYLFAEQVSRGRPLWSYLADTQSSDTDLRQIHQSYSWVEIVARGHLRDTPVIAELEKIIASQPDNRSLTVMSHQGGMVLYYLAKRFFGRIEFIDLCGLFSSHVGSCRQVIDLASFQTPFNSGTLIPWEYYFEHKERLQKECNFPVPDIIVDLYWSENVLKSLEQNGYAVVFKSRGYIKAHAFLENDYGPCPEFIALRKATIHTERITPVLWDWDQK
ncbi:MAG: hypothetical protein ABSH28_07245 [Acidobacteriota bacterium]|jgi:hypothetical protein